MPCGRSSNVSTKACHSASVGSARAMLDGRFFFGVSVDVSAASGGDSSGGLLCCSVAAGEGSMSVIGTCSPSWSLPGAASSALSISSSPSASASAPSPSPSPSPSSTSVSSPSAETATALPLPLSLGPDVFLRPFLPLFFGSVPVAVAVAVAGSGGGFLTRGSAFGLRIETPFVLLSVRSGLSSRKSGAAHFGRSAISFHCAGFQMRDLATFVTR